MDINVDSEAKKWIASKGNQLTVKMLDVKACCGPDVQDVIAVPGKPKTLEQYNEIKIDEISIYVQKYLCGKKKLSLKLSGVFFFKTISAKLE